MMCNWRSKVCGIGNSFLGVHLDNAEVCPFIVSGLTFFISFLESRMDGLLQKSSIPTNAHSKSRRMGFILYNLVAMRVKRKMPTLIQNCQGD